MQSAIPIEQAISNSVKTLPPDKQQAVLAFIERLQQQHNAEVPKTELSLKDIVRLPISERHKILQAYVPAMAEDFENDPALTEFAELDMDSWDADCEES